MAPSKPISVIDTGGDDLERGLAKASEELSKFCKAVQFVPIPCEESPFGRLGLALKSLVTPDPYTINWLKSPVMGAAIDDWNLRYSFDAVHFDTISLAPYRDRFPKCKKILDHHNIESHMMYRRAEIESNPLKKAYFWQEAVKLGRYEKRACPDFDLHVTCSALDSDRLGELVPGLNIVDIPNGVDLDYFRPSGEAQKPTSVVFAGNMSWYPNRAAMEFFATEVWPKLKATVPDVQADVIGANAPGELAAMADSDPSFRVRGFVDDVRPYIDRAAVYVCPIMDGGGTKLKVLDALAMGKALVANPIACEGIDVREGESVLFAETGEEFVRQITRLFNDDALRLQIGRKGRELVEGVYGYKSIGEKFAGAIESLIK